MQLAISNEQLAIQVSPSATIFLYGPRRHREAYDFRGAGSVEFVGGGREGEARRVDVVQEQNRFSFHVFSAIDVKGAFHIFFAIFFGKERLLRRIANADEAIGIVGHAAVS